MPAVKRSIYLSPARRRKLKIITGTFFLLLIVETLLQLFSFPNTAIGSIPVGGKTRGQIAEILSQAYRDPLTVRVKGKPYVFAWRELGIEPDIDRSVRYAFYPNTRFFPKNLILFFLSLVKTRTLPAPVDFSRAFENVTARMVFDYSRKNDEITLHENASELTFVENEERYVIDRNSLVVLIHTAYSPGTVVAPALIRLASPTRQTVEVVNARLSTIYSQPLTLLLTDRSHSYPVTLPGSEIRRTVFLRNGPDPAKPRFVIDENELQALIESKKNLYRLPPSQLPIARIAGEVLGVVSERFDGSDISQVTVPVDGADIPASRYLPKFAEISIAKQRMLVYSHGDLIREFRISTGLYYPTPTGQFRILNKAPNAFSKIYNVFMPWWMAFGYSAENGAYFGFHELPYWFTEDGTKMQRPREKIGEPATGGCIALDIGEAREFYEFADVGMPVSIIN